MTIICALHDPLKGETWIGCDSRTTFGPLVLDYRTSKWVRIAPNRVLATVGAARGEHLAQTKLVRRTAPVPDDAWALADLLRVAMEAACCDNAGCGGNLEIDVLRD